MRRGERGWREGEGSVDGEREGMVGKGWGSGLGDGGSGGKELDAGGVVEKSPCGGAGVQEVCVRLGGWEKNPGGPRSMVLPIPDEEFPI